MAFYIYGLITQSLEKTMSLVGDYRFQIARNRGKKSVAQMSINTVIKAIASVVRQKNCDNISDQVRSIRTFIRSVKICDSRKTPLVMIY